jgi:hypothetical protein
MAHTRSLIVAAVVLLAAAEARADDPRAPALVKLHPGAQAGDWLERVSSTHDGIVRERWTYLGDRDGKSIVEASGPSWPGVVLELAIDPASGKVVEAKAAPPGKADELKPIAIAAEPAPLAEKTQSDEDVEVPAGIFHCRRVLGERTGERRWRWVALDGSAKGFDVKTHTQHWDGKAWRETVVFAVDVKDEPLDFSGKTVACLKLVKRVTHAGARQPDASEWIARTPVFFGERIVKSQSASANVLLYWGQGGKSQLQPPPKPTAPPPPEPTADTAPVKSTDTAEKPADPKPAADAPKPEEPAKPSDAPKPTAEAPKPEKPADAPKPADAGGEWIDVPGYEDVKVGQKYVFKQPNGVSAVWEIAEKNETAYSVKMVTAMDGKALGEPVATPMPFRVKKGDDKPAAGEAPKPTGKETLKIAGVDWECEIYEVDVGGQKMKTWQARKFPFAIKTEMNGAPTMELVEIK